MLIFLLCRVACAAFGGPIAMVRDEAKATLVRGVSTTAAVVRLPCHDGFAMAFSPFTVCAAAILCEYGPRGFGASS